LWPISGLSLLSPHSPEKFVGSCLKKEEVEKKTKTLQMCVKSYSLVKAKLENRI
jgi:hypothetical protein